MSFGEEASWEKVKSPGGKVTSLAWHLNKKGNKNDVIQGAG